jgi:plasmid stabilization system protein ParE
VYSVHFTQIARTELVEAQDWYEAKAARLGRRFREAIDSPVERMSANPLQFPIVHRSVRRSLLRRFPYALFFVIEDDDRLLVIACFHSSRDPAPLGESEPDPSRRGRLGDGWA